MVKKGFARAQPFPPPFPFTVDVPFDGFTHHLSFRFSNSNIREPRAWETSSRLFWSHPRLVLHSVVHLFARSLRCVRSALLLLFPPFSSRPFDLRSSQADHSTLSCTLIPQTNPLRLYAFHSFSFLLQTWRLDSSTSQRSRPKPLREPQVLLRTGLPGLRAHLQRCRRG